MNRTLQTKSPALWQHPVQLIGAALVGLYFLWCAWDPSQWHLIDGANLLIHEAGHLFFRPLGEFMMIAGGSLFQVIMPAIFVGYFIRRKIFYSAAMVLFWVGESILNVSVYAADSLALQLPLIGGPDTIHDWNYMLGQLGMLKATPKIAGFIRLLGTLVMVCALVWAIKSALKNDAAEEEPTFAQPQDEWWTK
ncbi:MAG: hypothetical protein HY231_18715 [Acidobacteria bacterium]|nr:hypothetical protein [Acidobacteriota bacterium]